MVGEIISALGLLKTAAETAKAMVAERDTAIIQEKAIELQSQILSAQQFAMASDEREKTLRDTIEKLKADIQARDNWEETSKDYEIRLIGDSPVIVSTPDTVIEGDPHWNCVNCFRNQRLSPIAFKAKHPQMGYLNIFHCQTCKADVTVPRAIRPCSYYQNRDGNPEGDPAGEPSE